MPVAAVAAACYAPSYWGCDDGRQEGLEAATTRGFEAVNLRLDRTNERLDNVLKMIGDHHRELEARATGLEERLKRAGL